MALLSMVDMSSWWFVKCQCLSSWRYMSSRLMYVIFKAVRLIMHNITLEQDPRETLMTFIYCGLLLACNKVVDLKFLLVLDVHTVIQGQYIRNMVSFDKQVDLQRRSKDMSTLEIISRYSMLLVSDQLWNWTYNKFSSYYECVKKNTCN